MIDTKRKEELSISYLSAVCAYKGIAVERQDHDDDSVDVLIHKMITRKDGCRYDAQLSIQLKSTSSHYKEYPDYISYDLKAKNYHDLTSRSSTQKILALLILPDDENDWITHNVDYLIIRRCMYWFSFANSPIKNNTSGVTLHIPKANFVSSDTVLNLLEKVAEEETL